jgi:hypothetical protein
MPNTEKMEERLRFLEIDQDIIEELHSAKQILEPEIDRMLDEFYAHILEQPQLKRIFADDKAITRAREAQKNHWLKTLFDGEFDSAYFDRAELIGRAHARVGLTPNWYIGGYCNMLVKFIRHVLAVVAEDDRDASPIIETICKAVLLDLDLVVHSYLEAKDLVTVDLLMRATRFTDDVAEMNSELGLATAQINASTEALLKDATEDDRQAGHLAKLHAQTDELADKVRQLDERIRELKFSGRPYLPPGLEHTGMFAKLRTQVSGNSEQS